MEYLEFLKDKNMLFSGDGFKPRGLNPYLKDFQADVTEWCLMSGRSGIFADCGLGKTLMQLEWSHQVSKHTNKNILIMTPLSVARQTVKEGEKFGIEANYSGDGKPTGKITVTNYQKLHMFDPNDFDGIVCDESSILKNFNGATRLMINDFMKDKKYSLLCTATAAPNDYTELGTSSGTLAEVKHALELGLPVYVWDYSDGTFLNNQITRLP